MALLLLTAAACDSGSSGGDDELTASVSFSSTPAYVAGRDVQVTGTVQTAGGQPVEGVDVTWSGDGAFSPSTGTTGPDGQVATTWTLATDKVGQDAQAITFSVADGPAPTERVSVNPGPVAFIRAAAADTVIAVDSTTVLSITEVEDEFGNAIEDRSAYTFQWTSATPDSAVVEGESTGESVVVRGVGDGRARIDVSTGGAPTASADAVAKADGAAATAVEVDVRRAEMRGVWLTNVDSNVLDSRANIEEAMQFLADNNFNVVFPVVWNKAATMYPSTVMDTLINRPIDPTYEGRDPLQEIIDEAKKHGIAVIPWFEFGFSSSYSQNGGPIIDKYPSWAAKTESGDLVVKNGFDWMNAYKPAVQNLLMSLIMEVVNNYDVDGIQGDDRLPANPVEGGYSEYTASLYESDTGQRPPANENDTQWKQWRADKLADFGQRVYENVKAVDERLIVSWSPSPYPFGYNEYLQDYPQWVDRGITDVVHPQLYRRDVSSYKFLVDQQLGYTDQSKVIGFYPGVLLKVGSYVAEPDDMVQVVQYNRSKEVYGEVFFFYEGLREFDADVTQALTATVYRDPAPIPFPLASDR